MKLSYRAIEICKQKCGKSGLVGFENPNSSLIDDISESEAVRDFNGLLKAGLVMLSGDEVQMSPLGWHIVKMLNKPNQYIEITNTLNEVCVRFYHRDTNYLCSIENLKKETVDDFNRFHFELLPDLDLVVGAFSYSLYPEWNPLVDIHDSDGSCSVIIKAIAWDEAGRLTSKIDYIGRYNEDSNTYESISDNNNLFEEIRTETVSSLINKLTDWLLKRISENLKENEYVKI